MLTQRIYGHTFFCGFLGPSSTVLDLGANEGRFCREIQRSFGSQCIAVEANARISDKIPKESGIRTLNCAISAIDGEMSFNIAENSETSSLLEGMTSLVQKIQVQSRRLETLARDLGLEQIDLVKFDIEGAEIEALETCSDSFLQTIGQLTIEFHDFNGMIPTDSVNRVINRLRRLGFRSFRESRNNEDVVFINALTCRISPLQFWWAANVERNIRGMLRIVRRWRNSMAAVTI